jgi:hypothetical protein
LADLCFDKKEIEKIKGDPCGVLRNSFTPLYWMWLPVWRPIMKKRGTEIKEAVNVPGKKVKTKIVTNEVIDESVWERWEKNPSYRPKNLKEHLHLKDLRSAK